MSTDIRKPPAVPARCRTLAQIDAEFDSAATLADARLAEAAECLTVIRDALDSGVIRLQVGGDR